MEPPDANTIAEQIAISPRQRADFFQNAEKAISSAGRGSLDADTKQEVVKAVNRMIKEDRGELESSANANAVTEQFFKAAMRNPQLSFNTLIWMAVLTFIIGTFLIAAGGVLALVREDETEKILSGVFGASGVLATLASTYTLATRGVSKANADNTQLRLIIADFATELGHLRAIKRNDDLATVITINKEIRSAMTKAVELIHGRVKGEEED